MASLVKQLRLEAKEARARETAAQSTWDLEAFLFLQQLELARCPDRFVTVCCTRRAGKSFTAIGALIDCCLSQSRDALYVSSTIDAARAIIWKDLCREAEKHGGESKEDSTITFANGAVIRVRGLSDARQGGRVGRGVKYGQVIVDEAQEIASDDLEAFVTEDVVPALVGVNGQANGRIWMMGTPSEFKNGFWYRQHHHPALRHFEWSGEDNPHMRESFLKARDEEVAKHGRDDPRVQREWFNVWIASLTSLVLPSLQVTRNAYAVLPGVPVSASLGIDLGFGKDPTALAVLVNFRDRPGYWIAVEKRLFSPTFDDIEKSIVAIMDEWPVQKIYIDPANGGRGFADSFEAKYGWPIKAAHKFQKESRLAIMDSLLRTGRLFAPEGGLFLDEGATVIWDARAMLGGKKVVSSETPNDVMDAVQYALCDDEMLALEGVTPVVAADSHAGNDDIREELRRVREAENDPFRDRLLDA
jgi:hypothetical protein